MNKKSIVSFAGVVLLTGAAVGAISYVAHSRGYQQRQDEVVFEVLSNMAEDPFYNDETHPLIGSPAPNFTLTSLLEEESHSLSDYIGKPVVINWWEEWCPPCKDEMPTIESFIETYGDQVHVIGIAGATDMEASTRERASDFAREYGSSFPNVHDRGLLTRGLYGINSFPYSVIISKGGIIEAFHRGETDYMDPNGPIITTVDRLLAQ